MLLRRLVAVQIAPVLALALAVSVAGLPGRAEAPAQAPVQTPVQIPVEAPVPADIAALSETMKIDAVMEVMRLEGLEYGSTLEAEMFPGRGGAEWRAVVGLIYDPAVMRRRFDAALGAELADDPAAVAVMQDFFAGERGQRILSLEIEARRALMDDATEEAAKIAVEDMIAAQDPRIEVLRRFSETNDLIESNVTGALNANLAFYQGLSEGGAFENEMTEEQMLSDVWSQEPDIRAETEEWLFSYLALAYQPLSDEDMAAYQAVSETPEGRKLNAALFTAFDAVFTAISRDLGRAAARQVQGEDI